MSEPPRIGLAGLNAGPIACALRLEAPGEQLGELPLPFERVDLQVEIRRVGGHGVRVRGTLAACAAVECRRCLAPTQVDVDAEWEALFRPSARITPGEEGVWALEAEARELDLTAPIREELWVHAPEYPECSDECPGLCSRCGVRLADGPCDCPPPGPDPRWAALDGLRG